MKTRNISRLPIRTGRLILILVMLSCTYSHAQGSDPALKPNITVGWTYLWADQGGGERSNLNGWFARPALTLGKGCSVFADFTNYYGANHKGAINSHGYTFGFSKNVFAKPRIKPAVFAEAGDVRSSNVGSIVNQFAFATGASVSLRLKSWLAFTITPAEYIFLYPKGDVRNDYNSKLGVTFSFGH